MPEPARDPGRAVPARIYIDARIYRSWDHPQLVLDIAPGNPEGFSLGPGGGLQFVTKASAN